MVLKLEVSSTSVGSEITLYRPLSIKLMEPQDIEYVINTFLILTIYKKCTKYKQSFKNITQNQLDFRTSAKIFINNLNINSSLFVIHIKRISEISSK